MANIRDVARAAGVSTSTVSRIINNSATISQETRERVLKEIKRLGFSPNLLAKGLTTKKSYTITLLVDVDDENAFYNPFFNEILHGIERFVYKKDYSLIVANLNATLKKKSVIDWLYKGKRTDGIILPTSILQSSMVKHLKDEGIPFVAISEPTQFMESLSWVDVDNKKGAALATYALIEKGYQRIAFIGHNQHKLFGVRRLEGYQEALVHHGKKIQADYIVECQNTKEEGYRVAKQLLALNEVPDAIICADSFISMGVIHALQETGISIPNQMGIISFDDDQVALLSYPTISTINVDVFELGIQAAKLLFELIENPLQHDQGLLIATSLEERETTR